MHRVLRRVLPTATLARLQVVARPAEHVVQFVWRGGPDGPPRISLELDREDEPVLFLTVGHTTTIYGTDATQLAALERHVGALYASGE